MRTATLRFNQLLVGQLRFGQLRDDRRALTALEYGIIAGWLALTIVGIFTRLGSGLSTIFGSVTTSL
jgi:Flp pilus assembly pilin Flp